ncbi:MAG TPA: DMT family transporter [Rhodothermales bacterium]|nr:DMT family transporter [Rhodothermales bacterium]
MPRWSLPLSPGLRLMVLAALGFSLMTLCAKLIGPRIPTEQLILVRTVITLFGTLALLWRQGVSPVLGRHRGWLFLRGAAGFIALDCLFYAVPRLPLAEATIFQYLNPILVTLLAWPFLGERITRGAIGALGLCIVGLFLVARPGWLFGAHVAGLDTYAVGIALLGALMSSVAYLAIRRIGTREHPLVIVLYLPLVSLPSALFFTLGHYVPPTPTEWALLIAIGVLTQGAQLALTRGLQLEAAGRATTVGYLQIVFAAVWGVLFLGEVPTGWSLLGAGLILGGVVGASRGTQRPPAGPAEDNLPAGSRVLDR